MTRKSTANKKNKSGIDRRQFNKGRIENLRPWPPGVSGNPEGRRIEQRHEHLRELIQFISSETLSDTDITRLEVMIRMMFTSKNPADHSIILEHGWGKVPQQIQIDIVQQIAAELHITVEEAEAKVQKAAEVLVGSAEFERIMTGAAHPQKAETE